MPIGLRCWSSRALYSLGNDASVVLVFSICAFVIWPPFVGDHHWSLCLDMSFGG